MTAKHEGGANVTNYSLGSPAPTNHKRRPEVTKQNEEGAEGSSQKEGLGANQKGRAEGTSHNEGDAERTNHKAEHEVTNCNEGLR